MNTPTIISPSRTMRTGDWLFDQQQARADAAQDARESHDEMVKRIAKERLARKLAELNPVDIVAGLHSAIPAMHGDMLRAAFQESAEAFGDAVMNLVVHEMRVEAEVEALEVVERIEGAARVEQRRTYIIAGQ